MPDILSTEAAVRQHFPVTAGGRLAPEDLSRAALRLLINRIATGPPVVVAEVAPAIECPDGVLCVWVLVSLVEIAIDDGPPQTVWVTLRQRRPHVILVVSCDMPGQEPLLGGERRRRELDAVRLAVAGAGGEVRVSAFEETVEYQVLLECSGDELSATRQ